jgi:hypothetical protein
LPTCPFGKEPVDTESVEVGGGGTESPDEPPHPASVPTITRANSNAATAPREQIDVMTSLAEVYRTKTKLYAG